MPKIQMRRDTAANWKSANPTLLAGEWALETDTRLMKIGDGTTAYNALPYSTAEDSEEWQKPADWIDIRSGALSNSVYFLVGHSADFSKYPKFLINATISNSGTYDVFVDGIKQATTASGTATTLDWQTLALESGWDVTYPEQLRTHIVRVTPTTSSNTLSSIKIPSTEAIEFGLLWVHFSISYALNINKFVREPFAGGYCYLLEAITANGDELNVTGDMEGSFAFSRSLKTIPTLVGNGSEVRCNRMFQNSSIPVVKLKNILLHGDQVFLSCSNLKKIETQNAFVATRGYVFDSTSSLIKLPPLYHLNTSRAIAYFLRSCTELKDTCLDFSGDNAITSLQIGGSSNARIDGLKALTVSNEAPFSNTTSPQIDVRYTGLDRQTLVNLFKSMPYNVGYEVVGSPTITDGVLSNCSSSNHIKLNSPLDYSKDMEIVFKLRLEDSYTQEAAILQDLKNISGVGNGMSITRSGKRRIGMLLSKGSSEGGTWNSLSYNEFPLEEWFYVKYIITSDTITLDTGSSLDSLTQVATTTRLGTTTGTDNPLIGYSHYWNIDQMFNEGQIDLNETYIKENGVPWFTGKEAMTKTCNIVGCTGTAELTQEDKNIALDKGWQLTVA